MECAKDSFNDTSFNAAYILKTNQLSLTTSKVLWVVLVIN